MFSSLSLLRILNAITFIRRGEEKKTSDAVPIYFPVLTLKTTIKPRIAVNIRKQAERFWHSIHYMYDKEWGKSGIYSEWRHNKFMMRKSRNFLKNMEYHVNLRGLTISEHYFRMCSIQANTNTRYFHTPRNTSDQLEINSIHRAVLAWVFAREGVFFNQLIIQHSHWTMNI